MAVTFRDRASIVLVLGASIAVPFAGCGDDTTFQPDASRNPTGDASPEASSDNDAAPPPETDAAPGARMPTRSHPSTPRPAPMRTLSHTIDASGEPMSSRLSTPVRA